jgi:serine/threonine-protein kinase
LSPEAALGESVDLRTDIFAVGIILWELLAGRRLFVGETDLQTVRQVQAAKIPDIKLFNPEVSRELEAILLKVLARDPRQRYQAARDLCRDLNTILFQLAKPVSSFEIADLVGEVIAEKDRKKARDKTSIIGTLIEDAMMEFTSLDTKGASNTSFQSLHSTTSSLASKPLDSFEDVQDWASDLGLDHPSADKSTSGFAAGNLAALEDDHPSGALQPMTPPLTSADLMRSAPAMRRPGGIVVTPPNLPSAAQSRGPASAQAAPLSAPPVPSVYPPVQQPVVDPRLGGHKTLQEPSAKQKMSPGVIALGVGLAAAAALAGAYMGGLLH